MAEITYRKKVKIGDQIYEFDIKGESLHDVIKPLSFGNVDKCGCCGSTKLHLGAHVAQGKFKYTTVKCGACKASLNFGQQQEDPSVYYLRTKVGANGRKEYDWQPMEGGKSGQQAPPQQNYQQQAPPQQQVQQGQAPQQSTGAAPNYYQNQQSYNNNNNQ